MPIVLTELYYLLSRTEPLQVLSPPQLLVIQLLQLLLGLQVHSPIKIPLLPLPPSQPPEATAKLTTTALLDTAVQTELSAGSELLSTLTPSAEQYHLTGL